MNTSKLMEVVCSHTIPTISLLSRDQAKPGSTMEMKGNYQKTENSTSSI